MAKRGFLSRHGITRNNIRGDLLYFAIPAVLVFFAGLMVSARDGWDGLASTVWDLIRYPQSLYLLSIQNIAGLVLIVIGFTITVFARITLGRFGYSTLVVRDNQQLVTHGIYRFVRHPIYLGAFMICFGVPIYASSLYGFLTMSVLIPITLNRIRMEEKILTEEFGDAYQAYKKATRKLIPFIY